MARRDVMVSDFYSHEVITVDEKGTKHHRISAEQPSGLEWDTQGELLINLYA